MISDSDNTSDWHCISISKSNTSVTSEMGVAMSDVLAINGIQYRANQVN